MWKVHKEKRQEEVKHKDRGFGARTRNADFVRLHRAFARRPGDAEQAGCQPGCCRAGRGQGAAGQAGVMPLHRAEPPNQCLLPSQWQSQGDFYLQGAVPFQSLLAPGCLAAPRPLSAAGRAPPGCARRTRKGQDTTPVLLESLLPLPCSDRSSLPDVLMLIKRKCINPQTPLRLPHSRLTFKTTGVFKTKAARCL